MCGSTLKSANGEVGVVCFRCERGQLERVLRYLLDESEFLSPYGVRGDLEIHKQSLCLRVNGTEIASTMSPPSLALASLGENSNGAGLCVPINFLLIEASRNSITI